MPGPIKPKAPVLSSERRLLANALVMAATIYVPFAMGHIAWVLIETAGILVYGGFAWAGKHHSPYWLCAGWLLHPVWDVALHLLGPGKSIAPTGTQSPVSALIFWSPDMSIFVSSTGSGLWRNVAVCRSKRYNLSARGRKSQL